MKKMKKVPSAIVISCLFTGIFTIFLVIACNKKTAKQNTTGSDASVSQMAKNYFSNLAQQEKAPPDQPSATVQKKITQSPVTPLSKMSALIQWEKAVEIKRDELTYTIIPVKDDMKKFKGKNYEFFRNIIFFKDDSHKSNMTIVEVLSKKGESLGNDLQKIAINAFENKYFSRSESIDALNAFVIFYDENYIRETSFELLRGKWMPARISFRSDLEITQ